MTSFYLTFRQVVSDIGYKEDIFVRDGTYRVGSIKRKGNKYSVHLSNVGYSSEHNNIHQARSKAEAVLSKVFESSPCINN